MLAMSHLLTILIHISLNYVFYMYILSPSINVHHDLLYMYLYHLKIIYYYSMKANSLYPRAHVNPLFSIVSLYPITISYSLIDPPPNNYLSLPITHLLHNSQIPLAIITTIYYLYSHPIYIHSNLNSLPNYLYYPNLLNSSNNHLLYLVRLISFQGPMVYTLLPSLCHMSLLLSNIYFLYNHYMYMANPTSIENSLFYLIPNSILSPTIYQKMHNPLILKNSMNSFSLLLIPYRLYTIMSNHFIIGYSLNQVNANF